MSHTLHPKYKSSNYWWEKGCRETECIEIHQERLKSRRKTPLGDPSYNADTPHPGMPGTLYQYTAKKCRCAECMATWKVKLAARPKSPRQKVIREHGNQYKYIKEGCHCALCTAAYTGAAAKKNAKVQAYRTTHKRKRAAAKPRVPRERTRAQTLKQTASKEVLHQKTFTPTSAVDCGEPLQGGGYCRRLYPCQIHPIE